jgi:hypothetical protein
MYMCKLALCYGIVISGFCTVVDESSRFACVTDDHCQCPFSASLSKQFPLLLNATGGYVHLHQFVMSACPTSESGHVNAGGFAWQGVLLVSPCSGPQIVVAPICMQWLNMSSSLQSSILGLVWLIWVMPSSRASVMSEYLLNTEGDEASCVLLTCVPRATTVVCANMVL